MGTGPTGSARGTKGMVGMVVEPSLLILLAGECDVGVGVEGVD